jgi:integrase
VWTIPTEAREKGNAGELGLQPMALDIIADQPRLKDSPYVFPGSQQGRRPRQRDGQGVPVKPSSPPAFNSFSQRKAELDKKLPGMAAWTLHDLRRTAKSLMKRAGVSSDHSERVLGHAIKVGGHLVTVTATEEKTEALQRLANLVERITNPPVEDNVVPLRR